MQQIALCRLIGGLLGLTLILSGCTSQHSLYVQNTTQSPSYSGYFTPVAYTPVDPNRVGPPETIANATPKFEPRSKYGNPDSYEVFGKRYHLRKTLAGYKQRGIASWYGPKFHNKRTSSGEPYDMYSMTAANKVLPIPCYVKVTNLENGRHAIVRVNDRGPFKENRIIDLSYSAAKKIGILANGTGLVEVEAIVPHHTMVAKQSEALSPASKLYLQLGAFSQRENAERLDQQLKQMIKRPVHLRQINSANRTFYRVQIGPLKDVADSDHIYRKLDHLGLGRPMTVIQ